MRDLSMSRNHLSKAYPASLKEIRFMAALDENSPYQPWFAGVGATGYCLIGNGFTKPPRVLGPEKFGEKEPIVHTDNLLGGIEYSDAYIVDNDSRFVFGFIRSALNSGATCVIHVSFESATREGGRWRVQMRDTDTGAELSATAEVIINAWGPFVDPINDAHGISTKHKIVFSKGIHLIVPRLSKSERVVAGFDDTQRLFYFIPLGTRSVIGTTDERVTEPVTDVTVEDRDFLLN